MNKKSIITFSLAASLVFTVGCNISSPNALIESPKILESQIRKEDVTAIVKQFLPNKSKLVDVSKIATEKPIIKMDVDNDRKDEIIGFYDIPESFEKGFVIIKEMDEKWNKIYEYKGEGNKILNSEFIDIYGDGKKTLLFGNLISTHAGATYNLFTFNDDKINKVDLGTWNKIDILNTSLKNDKKGFVFAGWSLYGPDKAYGIDLVRFDGKKFTYAKDLYPQYFKDVVKYYKDIMAENSKDVALWYFLADSQVKANMYNDALNSIEKGINANNDKNGTFKGFDNTEFNLLKAQSLNGLKKYDEEKNILENAVIEQLKKLQANKKDKDNKTNFIYMKDETVLANIYLELSKSYYNLKQADKGMEYNQKYMDVIKNLEKKEYFNDSLVKDAVK